MNINRKMTKIFPVILITFFFSCIFAPKEGQKIINPPGKWQEPITPGKVIENLKVAFSNLDIDFYERCLHEDYYYESPSQIDSLNVESWSRSTDVLLVEKIFDDCTTFVFTPSFVSLEKEYGINIPDIPQGEKISDEHPDEIWYIYNYDISMDMYLKSYGDIKVQQFMKFVMVMDSEGLWSIIRWIDETPIIQ
jgi:hypothetical protein